MVNDGHTTRPRCATRSLGERYIDGKPEEVPPDTRRSKGSRSNRYAPQWSTTATAKVRPTKFGKNLDLRGCTQSESQESKAPNPNPNDFILEPRSGSQKSADGYRDQDHENKQWSAEAITVRGIINIIAEVDNRGSNQTHQLKDHTSIESS